MASNRIPPGEPKQMTELAAYADGSVVSRALVSGPAGNVTLFAFDAGQALSEHIAPYDALAHVLDGTADISVGGVRHRMASGDVILLPANVPHAVEAVTAFKMVLTMIRA